MADIVARPRNNITGFTSFELTLVGKRLELLKDVSPGIARVLFIRNPRAPTDALYLRLTENASALGLTVIDGPAANDADLDRAIASFAREPGGGLNIAFDAFNIVHREKIVELAAYHRLPAIYPFRFFVQDGGLFSYGFDRNDPFRQAASYVDRILKGAKPSDLPVQAPAKFELVINLRTAKALELTIPREFLLRADELIE
jgi:putative tryptophan/tyrosine transport system substrate-binding protein